MMHKETVQVGKCWVVRDGLNREVSVSDLVVGDLVILYAGGRVPADLRLVSSLGMRVDKSIFTGSSEPVEVTAAPLSEQTSFLAANNTVFMGTQVVEGSGTGIVIATGQSTQVSIFVQ
jgi:P-type E1-E2 ATPase